jgi:hypothetical protein
MDSAPSLAGQHPPGLEVNATIARRSSDADVQTASPGLVKRYILFFTFHCPELNVNSPTIKAPTDQVFYFPTSAETDKQQPEAEENSEAAEKPEAVAMEKPEGEEKPEAKEEPEAREKPAAKTIPEAKVKPAAKSKPEAKVEPAEKAKPEAKVKPAAKPKSEAKVKPAAKAKPEVKEKPVAKAKPEAKAKPASKKKTEKARKPVQSNDGAAKVEKSKAEKSKPVAKSEKRAVPGRDKVVRDSFTMPKSDYLKIGAVKERCLEAGVQIKKSEILRAGLLLLANKSQKELLAAVAKLETVKTGRPPKR